MGQRSVERHPFNVSRPHGRRPQPPSIDCDMDARIGDPHNFSAAQGNALRARFRNERSTHRTNRDDDDNSHDQPRGDLRNENSNYLPTARTVFLGQLMSYTRAKVVLGAASRNRCHRIGLPWLRSNCNISRCQLAIGCKPHAGLVNSPNRRSKDPAVSHVRDTSSPAADRWSVGPARDTAHRPAPPRSVGR